MSRIYQLKMILALLLLVSFINTKKASASGLDIGFTSVSIYALLATPDKYHDKKVQFIGFLNLEFEENAVYAHKSDFEQAILKNSIWVDIKPNSKEKIKRGYVLIRGVFKADEFGHFGLFTGAIRDIERLEPHKSRMQLESEL
ncbi:hypothetical protein [Pseudoalteromonas luteoviolacea]|uniref:Uncharacterized protein n=1 Tax=Pseudoalteromonas luteoviolacea NCIMB 1942 TaxID=1365253 RepID=A0A161YA72_9GAMM|nr:hypothetical protein [Pseudoalteromonas luteoviolacea]KZN54011.1 hypothetical protein N482_24655 [Pseudoalteromonas luteoviolacea NCIMB 1942]